ncbi:hypothetical protein BV22DRAFT_1193856 [Leucogyrophana mollusca]|uniref:Uncharacterized protein n=1 Tax=Leucogyrophana mollusca TaxID=85980 RepID=A0ACB8BPU0_9AGAM|nr:hypothetical protein BV22DRAFT_1193856 [Leucogyrophana mollusca]
MKITQKSKRATPPHPQVAELIKKLLNTSSDNLPQVLSQIDTWKWPRSDLNAWTKVLDKFDDILEEAIRDYDVDKLQINSFTPVTKQSVCEILRFERLLLENSTNRKTYNSYDRLSSLLFASDLDVLILTLNLLLRPSQQYSAQPAVSHALNISTPRLLSLSKRWPSLHEYGISLLDLASVNGVPQVDLLPTDARDVSFTYYRTDAREKEQKPEPDVFDATPTTPRKPANASSSANAGAINIHIDEETLKKKEVMETLADVMELHPLSNDDKFELLCRLRSAKALATGNQEIREKLVAIRLLAIAIYGHTHSESQALSSLFLYEPDLATHIAEMLQLDCGVSVSVQTAAIAALDSLARYRGKIQEVLAAVNAGVNHGILMTLLRKTIVEVSNPESKLPHAFVEALLSFVTYLASHTAGGNMVVGAGLVPLLVQIIENRLAQRLQMVSKAMQLVDNVLYGFTNAFQLFSNGRGVDVLVDRIQHEVDFDITMYSNESRSHEVFGSYGELPVARAAVLKHTLRSMHRMMQASGTSEGLRGLIDSSLLQSIKKVIEYRGLFGPSILPLAMNIMATFVHNEPTSLPTIQEAGLPLAFYKAIETGLEPVIEVIQAIPNAIGALCLNQAGQDQLSARPSIIPGIFSIFTSERHMKVLRDKENAVLIGTAMDELIRHHPSLKTPVFEAVKSTLSKIEDLGEAYVVPNDLKQWYNLIPVTGKTDDGSAPMEGVEDEHITSVESNDPLSEPKDDSTTDDDPSLRAHDNHVVLYIDVICRFLEGLFQHIPHCKDFIRNVDGLDRIGRLTALPCLPYDYANSVASDSLVQVVRTMAEVGPNEALHYLSRLVGASLSETNSFWGTLDSQSKLLPLLELTEAQSAEGNQQFRNLIALHIRISLMADVFSTAGYAHGRAAIGLLQTLMGEPPKVINDLGSLHRACVWENILFKAALASKGINVDSSADASPLERSPSQTSLPLPHTSAPMIANGVQPELSAPLLPSSPESPTKEGPQESNARALKHLTHGLPSALSPFFQSIVKLFYARRNPDPTQKKQILASSSVIANVILEHMKQEVNGDKLHCLDYYSVMLGLLTILLVDARTMQNTLHTVLLLAFQRLNGLEAIFDVCQNFVATIDASANIKPEARSEQTQQELVHAQGGLKVALHLIHPLISSKPLFESGQTVLVMTRDKKDTDPDYFEPHHFLVRLRLASVPLLRSIWEAPWLVSSPLPLVKAVIQTVLELTGAENEELKGDPAGDVGAAGVALGVSNGLHIRATGPDENRIRQLTDMGFPRSAAERALLRTHNNVNAATELLLSHPFPYPPDPQPNEAPGEPEPEAPEGTTAEGGDAPSSDEGMAIEDASTNEAEPQADPTPVLEQGKGFEEWRQELNAVREPLRSGLSRQSLRLVDEHPSLIFDVQSAFRHLSDGAEDQSMRFLIDDIQSFSPGAYDVQEEPLAVRCRLLALVLTDSPSIPPALGRSLMDSLLALLLSNPISVGPQHPSIPTWLASLLLVTESLLNLGEQPSAIALPKEEEPIVSQEIHSGPCYPDARSIVFDFCIRLLSVPNLPRDEFLSTLRLLVLLTRNHNTASELVKRDGVSLIFSRLKSSPVAGSQSYVAIILRHVAEDSPVLHEVMQQEVKRYFSQPRTRISELSGYMRHCSAMALRDPGIFVQVTQSACQLQQPYSAVQHVTLKLEPSQSGDASSTEGHASEQRTDMQVDMLPEATSSGSPEALDSLVHYLISELTKNSKALPEPMVDASSSQTPKGHAIANLPTTSAPVSATADSSDQGRHSYSCFLMQCLTELLFSYDACKAAFLSYSPKKRPQTPAKEAGSKHRTAALQFFLSELVTFGTIDSQPDAATKGRFTLCTWAMSVIVALCVDSSPGSDSKEVSPELVSARKLVLEAISRSIKEPSVLESLDAKYGRLLALADLCNRLLTVRFNNGNRKPQDESTTHIAKIMLEKNFVSALTNALAEVDLNYPNIRTLVASMLKPLENLTRVAIKMSRASDKAKDSVEGKAESAISVSDDDDDADDIEVDEPGREETPDLYRNSSLGMFRGEMEDVHYAPEDEMDEGDEDEDEEMEMEFGDETGSDATSNSDEEEDEEEGIDEASHGEGHSWQDEDDEYEEDLVENGEGDDRDEGEDDPEHDHEAEEEMMWQDVQEDDEGVDDAGEEADEEDEPAEPIAVIHAEQEDEPDMLSDDDDFRGEIGIVDIRDAIPPGGEEVFNFVDAFGHGDGENDPRAANPFVSRRHRGQSGEDVQVFGRARNAPSVPSEATVHPLLLDTSTPANRGASGLGRGARRAARGGPATHNDLIQSIEEIIGDGATHMFQHVVGRNGAALDTIRLDVTPAGMVNLERGFLQRRGGGLFAGGVRVERPRQTESRSEDHSFDPLLTLQRWGEEAKTLNGKHTTERANKIGNHAVVALLPAAVEAAKLREEQRQQAQHKAEEEAIKQRVAERIAAEEAESAARAKEEATGDQQAETTPDHSSQSVSAPAQESLPSHATVATSDVEMADASITSTTAAPDATNPLPETTDSAVAEEAGPIESSSEPSQAAERVTVTIHGSEVDITDMGIDPTFLEALPDDIREEVINQHVRDQRAARVERPPDSQISTEFLDALPPEIRAELIQQERLEQARQAPPTAPTSGQGPPAAPADIDPASFIASLDPQLRQVVLLDSDEGFIQTLPSYMIAEAGVYRDEAEAPRRHFLATRGPGRAVAQRSAPPRKVPPPRDAIQLLDKTGVATLVRLLFFPQVSKKNLLFKVLVNLCENAKTRAELFNLLLSILQSGPGDLAAVDKSFAQMSTRTPKLSVQQTPKTPGKQKAGLEFAASPALANLQHEAVPDLVTQRCLEAMTYIVSTNELSSLFFLTEHELPAALRKAASKKGKGKEKQMPQTHFPIVLLLGLLDRQSLLKTPSNMDSVVALLSTVTKPLTTLKDAKKEPEPAPTNAPTTESSTLSTTSPPPTSSVSQAPPEASSNATASEEVPKDSSPPADQEDKVLLPSPPQIPHSVLRLIVNILAIGECSSRTFQQSLTLIQNLSHIPDARDVIAQELKAKAQDCGQSILIGLNELVTALQSSQNGVLAPSVATRFSSASSDQTKLLRVLKTIDYMYTPRSPPINDARQSEDAEKVQIIYESFRFTPLWRRLGDCLATIEQNSDLEHVATVLLPLIEALMVVCKYVGSKSVAGAATRALRASASPLSPTTPKESMEDLFVSFTDAHRKVLNLMVRNNPSLMSGSFALLVHNPRVLDFDNKRNYFAQQLHRRPTTREHHGTLQLNVRRARVFEDSFQYLQRKTGDQIKHGKLSVRFYDEEGVDAGGVTREWFQILARQMFDPNNALFQPCAADRLTYQPNKNSWVNPEHLSFFKFVGRVIGKAIYDGRLLDAYFAKSLYRQLLGKPVDYRDVEWVDPEYYNSLCWILENDPTPLDLTFSVEADEFGRNRIFPLKQGGESIPVTQENKREFVQLSANFRLYSSISEQIENLVAGFQEIIPKDLINIFNEKELELLISGTPDIDVDEWRAATEYNGYTSSDPVIVWWWRALKSFNREERAKVLSFATGTSRVPLGGFVDLQGVQGVQRFSIHRAYGDSDRLPQAHTCFNQIDLPQYSSYEMLRQQLLLAINEGGEGFGFA